jgi:hypothetical protein
VVRQPLWEYKTLSIATVLEATELTGDELM